MRRLAVLSVVSALVLLVVAPMWADQYAKVRLVRSKGLFAEGGGEEDPPPSGAGTHGYFDTLCARADAVACYGLRDDTEINQFDSGGGAGEGDVAYDATEDSAGWVWLTDEKNGERLYLPLNEAAPTTGFPFPVAGSDKILIISDVRWDDSWDTECNMSPEGRTCGWKLMQLARGNNSSTGNTMFEYQVYLAQNSVPLLGPLSPNGWVAPYFRTYPTVTSSMGGFICSADTADRIALNSDDNPTLNGDTDCFVSPHSKWIRYFTEITRTAGNSYMDVSVWMADEDTDPISVAEGVRVTNADGALDLYYFWMEFDTSSDTRTGGTMKAWMRDFIVLKDYPEATESLLEKPLATNFWTYTQGFDAYTTAALHGQDGWSAPNVAGETMFQVQGTTTCDGAKAVEMELSTHPRIQKTLPAALATGDLTFYLRKSHVTLTEQIFNLIDTGNSKRIYVRFGDYSGSTGNAIYIFDGSSSTYTTVSTGLSANTCYAVNLQFDSTVDQYRIRVKAAGGSYGAWSSWVSYNGSTGSAIETIELTGEGDGGTPTHKAWFDLIAPWGGS